MVGISRVTAINSVLCNEISWAVRTFTKICLTSRICFSEAVCYDFEAVFS